MRDANMYQTFSHIIISKFNFQFITFITLLTFTTLSIKSVDLKNQLILLNSSIGVLQK
jgi:hypothetical protein